MGANELISAPNREIRVVCDKQKLLPAPVEREPRDLRGDRLERDLVLGVDPPERRCRALFSSENSERPVAVRQEQEGPRGVPRHLAHLCGDLDGLHGPWRGLDDVQPVIFVCDRDEPRTPLDAAPARGDGDPADALPG